MLTPFCASREPNVWRQAFQPIRSRTVESGFFQAAYSSSNAEVSLLMSFWKCLCNKSRYVFPFFLGILGAGVRSLNAAVTIRIMLRSSETKPEMRFAKVDWTTYPFRLATGTSRRNSSRVLFRGNVRLDNVLLSTTLTVPSVRRMSSHCNLAISSRLMPP